MIKILLHSLMLYALLSAQAFAGSQAQIDLQVVNNNQWPAQYRVVLTPPAHHHAYLDKGLENAYIPVTLDPKNQLAAAGLAISAFSLPAGVFDAEVKATVLRQSGTIDFSVTPSLARSAEPSDQRMDLRYQLCDDITHVCYRPQTAQLSLPLPAIGYTPEALALPAIEEADATWMEQLLTVFNHNQNNSALLMALMFLAGLLSVATPCVYPMMPITSMLIINRAQGAAHKVKFHASAYFVGIVGTYMLLGLVAGMSGGAFNSFMQSAVVNLVFAGFFAFFALSMLGYFEFSFMQNEVGQLDQKTSGVNGYVGTWLMGSIAGLVISPCVGPIVFALLLQVADNIADKTEALAALGQTLSFWDKLTVAAQGSLLMGGFGLGVGLPFFVISVLKFKKMPKAGYWMNKVKYAFGFAILYFAYTYFVKGMGVLNVADEVVLMLAWGLVALWVAIVHLNILDAGAHDQHPSRKLVRFAGIVTLMLGGWLFISGLNQVPLMGTAQANAGVPIIQEANAVETEGGIVWQHNFAEAQQLAQQSGKPIFIDFYASWCANCLAFAKEAVHNPALNQALREQAITLKLVDKTPEFEQFKQKPEHRQLKIGLPYFAILDSKGQLQWSGTDYKAANTMMAVLQRLNQVV